jgi:hypothetical protein
MPCVYDTPARRTTGKPSARRWGSVALLVLALSGGAGCAQKGGSPLEAYQAELTVGAEHTLHIRTGGTLDLDYAKWMSAFSPGGTTTGSAPRMQSHGYEVDATLHTRVIELDDTGTLIAMRFSDYSATLGGQTDTRVDAYQAPFLVHMDKSGAFDRFDFQAGFPTDVAASVRGIVEPLQVVFASQADSDEWSATERTSQGEATLRYRVLGRSGDEVTLERTLLATQRELPQVSGLRSGAVHHALKVNQTSGKLVWSRSEGLVSLAFEEDVSAQVVDSTLSRHRLSYRAELTRGTSVELPSTRAEANALLAAGAYGRAAFYQVPAKLRAALGAQSVEDADRRFHAELLASPAKAAHNLRYFVRIKPDAAFDLAQRFDKLEPSAGNLRTLGHFYAALGAAGHREAQLAMADVIRSGSYRPESRDMAARGALSVVMPEPELADAVWNYREALAQVVDHDPGHLSLITNTYGALGGIEHASPAMSRAVTNKLASRLTSTADKAEKVRMLTALANVGDLDLTLPKVDAYLRHSDPDLRGAALRVFQKSSDDRAFARFAALTESEADPDVRREAVSIAQNMPSTRALHGWARTRVLQEADLVSRGRLVGLLGEGIPAHPENQAILRAMLATETERDVRKTLYRYVSPAGGAP